jgi:hypothetical protein
MWRLLISALWFSCVCTVQAVDECTPAATNVLGAQYPCVHPDNRATFRISAPDAKTVQVDIGARYGMSRGTDGVWTVTTPPLVPAPFPASIKAFRDSLDKGGIRYVYFESPGTAHEWLTWRRDLYDFAPRLFQ